MHNNFFPRQSCRLGRNVEEYGRARKTTDENIIWRMRIACFTRSEYAILNALPQQQLLRQCASVLRYTYLACLVCFCYMRPTCRTFSSYYYYYYYYYYSQPSPGFQSVRITYHVVHIHYSAKKCQTIWRVLSTLLSV